MIRIVSMSQGRQLWEGLTRELNLPGFSAQIRGAQMLEDWADPNGLGWTDPNYFGGAPNEQVDRIWFHFDPLRGGANMEADLDAVVDLLRTRIADVPIIMSLVFGLDGHVVCSADGQRSTTTHRDFSARLEAWAEGKDRIAVADLHVPDCSHFQDPIGHLTEGTGEKAGAEDAVLELERIDSGTPDPEPEPEPEPEPRFLDIEGNTHEADILWIAERGITKGINPPDNDLYGPELPVERDQMASFLRRGLEPVEDRLLGVETDIADHLFGHDGPAPAPDGPRSYNVQDDSELLAALNALDDGRGGTINFYGGVYEAVVVDAPQIRLRTAGEAPTFRAPAGGAGLHLRLGASFVTVDADVHYDIPAAARSYGILNQADKGVRILGGNFRGGRGASLSLPWSEAPMGVRQVGITPHPNPDASVPSVWSDWHYYGTLFMEFVFSGFGIGEAANAMVDNLVVRQFSKNAIWTYTGGPGADDAALRVSQYWLVSPENNQTMVFLEREAGARRNGGAVLLGGSTEAGQGNPVVHYAIQSDTNIIQPASFNGGAVGYRILGDARNNRLYEPAVRSQTGGVGPPTDDDLSQQQYRE